MRVCVFACKGERVSEKRKGEKKERKGTKEKEKKKKEEKIKKGDTGIGLA